MLPTMRVTHRESGTEMVINVSDFDPKIHAKEGEELETDAATDAGGEATGEETPDAVERVKARHVKKAPAKKG